MSITASGTLDSDQESWHDDASLSERARAVLALSRTLYVNGESTTKTIEAAQQLGEAIGVRARLIARWGELELEADQRGEQIGAVARADPAGVNMARVNDTLVALDGMRAEPITTTQAIQEIERAARTAPSPTWLFVLAAGLGAVALAVLFGARHFTTYALIFASAAGGALLRRALGRYSSNDFVQPFAAALLAGVVGAFAVQYQLSSSLRLVAVCPCMILMPGPHFLNGALDLIEGRIHLGASRVAYALLIVVAISTGLLFALSLFGVDLPPDPAGRAIPLWQDLVAAGIAVGAYSIFFSTPFRMLPWPIAAGVIGHAVHWGAITLGIGPALSALAACVVAALILTPVAQRRRMPFAAVGFAAVVSMMPGVFLFRMWSGLIQIARGGDVSLSLISSTISDGVVAATIILAMSLGLVVPKLIIDRATQKAFGDRDGHH